MTKALTSSHQLKDQMRSHSVVLTQQLLVNTYVLWFKESKAIGSLSQLEGRYGASFNGHAFSIL